MLMDYIENRDFYNSEEAEKLLIKYNIEHDWYAVNLRPL